MSASLWPHGLQHTRILCPPLSPGVCSNSFSLSREAIQPFHPLLPPSPFWLQSSPTSGSFPMSWHFSSGGQSIGASASVFPMNIQCWFPLGLTSLIFLLSKGLSRDFSSTTAQKHQFPGCRDEKLSDWLLLCEAWDRIESWSILLQ